MESKLAPLRLQLRGAIFHFPPYFSSPCAFCAGAPVSIGEGLRQPLQPPWIRPCCQSPFSENFRKNNTYTPPCRGQDATAHASYPLFHIVDRTAAESLKRQVTLLCSDSESVAFTSSAVCSAVPFYGPGPKAAAPLEDWVSDLPGAILPPSSRIC